MTAIGKTISAANSRTSWFGGRIPIIIGTVGHRYIDPQNETIRKSSRGEFQRLYRQYRDSPFLILSSLAEGADRLLVEVAMQELPAKLIAVLPFAEDDYLADFRTERSRQEFRKLLSHASCRVVAPAEIKAPPKEDWPDSFEQRDLAYAWAAGHVAEQSQILVAVWDRRAPRGPGGTANAVKWFERGYVPPQYSGYQDVSPFESPAPGLSILIAPDSGKILWRSGTAPEKRSILVRKSPIEQILKQTQIYNRDLLAKTRKMQREDSLLGRKSQADRSLSEVGEVYFRADHLAVKFSTRLKRIDFVFYMLALGAIFAFNSVESKPIASWAFLGAGSLMGIIWLYVTAQTLETKEREYRNLSEAMRILFFWRFVGVKDHLWLSYLPKHVEIVRWIRHAIRAIEFTQDCRLHFPPAYQPPENAVPLTRRMWLRDQIDYYAGAIQKHSRRYHRLRRIMRVSLALSIGAALLLASVTIDYSNGWYSWREQELLSLPFGMLTIGTLIQNLQTLLGFTAATAVAARGMLLRRADVELIQQYSNYLQKAQAAEKLIDGGEWTPHQVFQQYGVEALHEQAEWMWLRHSRPFDVPN